MSGNPEIEGYASEFVANQSETTYSFRVHGYSGSVHVAEWEPLVSDGQLHDIEMSYDLEGWLRAAAEAGGVELTDDELWDLAGRIEMKILSTET